AARRGPKPVRDRSAQQARPKLGELETLTETLTSGHVREVVDPTGGEDGRFPSETTQTETTGRRLELLICGLCCHWRFPCLFCVYVLSHRRITCVAGTRRREAGVPGYEANSEMCYLSVTCDSGRSVSISKSCDILVTRAGIEPAAL